LGVGVKNSWGLNPQPSFNFHPGLYGMCLGR